MRIALATICIMVGLAHLPRSAAVPPELADHVPPDAIISVLVDGVRDAPTGGPAAQSLAMLLAGRAREMGLIPGESLGAGLFVDVATALPVITRHPWAVTLLDVASTPLSDEARHLADVRAGLIVLTDGNNDEIERQIRRTLLTYTNSQVSDLVERNWSGGSVYELRDKRLPEWVKFCWGPIGSAYVVTVGGDTFERIARAKTATTDDPRAEWLARARRECRSAQSVVEWTVDFVGLRRCLANAAPTETFDRALGALGMSGTDRAFWTVGSIGREITSYAFAHVGNADRRTVIAGPEIRNPLPPEFIPPEASTYAVFDHRPATLLRRLTAGYLAICREDWRGKLRHTWDVLEERTGLSFEHDVLDQLGDRIVIHTYPRHPLGIALLCTIELEITGSAERLRHALDILLDEYRQYLEKDRSGEGPFSVSLRHDEDGVWFLQAGIYGPALKVSDHWLVISFSPQAVRQNIAYLSRNSSVSQPATPSR